MKIDKESFELNRLILSAIDGTISQEEFSSLKQRIRENPEAAEHYIQFMMLYACLRQPGQISTHFIREAGTKDPVLDENIWKELAYFEHTAQTLEIPKPPQRIPEVIQPKAVPIKIQHHVSKIPLIVSFLSLAASLAMIVYVIYFYPRTSHPVVGVLTGQIGAQWKQPSGILEIGADLHAGSMHLVKGLAYMRLDSGAEVLVEAPAEFELLPVNGLSLTYGKIVAKVGRDAVGFTVNTPLSKVLDMGTEFGVSVEESGIEQIHVFKGEIALYPCAGTEHFAVSSGQGRIVDTAGRISPTIANPFYFKRPDEFASLLLAQKGNSYHRWKAFTSELQRDSSLIAHYFYERQADQPDCVVNFAASTYGKLNGHLGDEGRTKPQWAQGRWPQKQGIRFERDKQQVVIIPADPLLAITEPLTISTWIYFPTSDKYGGHLVSCRDKYRVNYQFSIFDHNYEFGYQTNRFEYIQYNRRDDRKLYSQKFIPESGQWYHFAVTYQNAVVSFYVNGILFESQPYPASVNPVSAPLIVGTMRTSDYAYEKGDFDGIIDELMIFKRSLTEDEIRRIYEAGKPD